MGWQGWRVAVELLGCCCVPAGDAGMADGRKTGGALGAVIAIATEVRERYEALIAVTRARWRRSPGCWP